MSKIDLFSEGVYTGSFYATLTEASAQVVNEPTATTLAEWGENSYHIFGFSPGGAGQAPDFTMQGQVSADFVNWQNVSGLLAEWKPSAGQGFGQFGVRLANYRLPRVRVGAAVGGGSNNKQAFRWLVNGNGVGSGSWTLNRQYGVWVFHKGSVPENDVGFQFQPGKPARLLLDWT